MKKLLFFFACLSIGLVQADPIKVITYNIRLDVAVDGVNQWGKRIQKVSDLLNQQKADIICVQEALPNQILDLQKILPAFSYVGVGREDGLQKGEFSAIFYRKDKFELETSNTFWLSETPEIPGSIGWDAAITRICTYAKLKLKKEAKSFWIFNTHFDHMGEKARAESAKLIIQKIASLAGSEPVILSGDFNSEPTSGAYQTIVNNKEHLLVDSYQKQDKDCTFTGFEVKSDICKRIDFIFFDAQFKASNFKILTNNDGTYYPSDHLPVMVVLNPF